jgi:hypothetical protein
MKLIKLLTVAACAFALVVGSATADEKKAEKKLKGKITAGSCCDKKIKAGETCTHPCCVEATKEGKVCTKCNKQEEKKEEAK